MYVTRPLSLYRRDPSMLSRLTPETEGLNSGYLVIADEETEAEDTYCWGVCRNPDIKKLPFPQNQIVDVSYSDDVSWTVWFIPVLDQPLSSNRYYVVIASGKRKGQACASSREEDMGTSCFCCKAVKDVKPRVLDHTDVYQQVEISKSKYGGFVAKSVSPDGFPPYFLRTEGWALYKSNSKTHQLDEASGLNLSLRMRLPELKFSPSNQYSTGVVVGNWYCPLVFIREKKLKYQMKNSLFYKMTLDQFWEEIYKCENDNYNPVATGNKNIVAVSASVRKESVKLFGEDAVKDDTDYGADGFLWFKPVQRNEDGSRLGLSLAIVEKMRWIQEKGGNVVGGRGENRDDIVRVEKVEEFGENGWRRFGCFVLVERFALRRMDGTLLLTWDYKHIHQIQSKWE